MQRRQFLLAAAGGVAVAGATGCGSDAHSVAIDTSLPVSEFGKASTAEEVTAELDLTGKTALVTGSTSGLGFETARVLAMRGAHVLATGRTLAKAETAAGAIDGRVTPLALELSDFDSVAACADQVRGLGLPLDMLICNAGINTFQDLELVGGVERMFVVNHLGHFILVNRLQDLVDMAAQGRVVHVGSRSGYGQAPAVGIDFDNLRGEGIYDAGEAYGRSKLANALFSLELAKRRANTSTTSNVIHPGLVQTNIARTAPGFIRGGFDMLGGFIAKTPEQGAATQAYVASHPSLVGVSGAYFEDCNPVIVSGPHHMNDAEMADRLWRESEDMTAGYLQE